MEIVIGLLIITIGVLDYIRDRAYAKRLMTLELAFGYLIDDLELLHEDEEEEDELEN